VSYPYSFRHAAAKAVTRRFRGTGITNLPTSLVPLEVNRRELFPTLDPLDQTSEPIIRADLAQPSEKGSASLSPLRRCSAGPIGETRCRMSGDVDGARLWEVRGGHGCIRGKPSLTLGLPSWPEAHGPPSNYPTRRVAFSSGRTADLAEATLASVQPSSPYHGKVLDSSKLRHPPPKPRCGGPMPTWGIAGERTTVILPGPRCRSAGALRVCCSGPTGRRQIGPVSGTGRRRSR
jgi:hypothetical protein